MAETWSTWTIPRYLAKDPHRLVLCTGEVMTELAKRLLDLNICSFLPDHSNNLANQFRWLCFGKYMINYYSF